MNGETIDHADMVHLTHIVPFHRQGLMKTIKTSIHKKNFCFFIPLLIELRYYSLGVQIHQGKESVSSFSEAIFSRPSHARICLPLVEMCLREILSLMFYQPIHYQVMGSSSNEAIP